MHVYSLVYYGLVFFSCSSSQPELYHGDANVVVSSDLYLDTIRHCTCWFTDNSLSISIGNIQFSGIIVEIEGKNGRYKPEIKFFSDYDEKLDNKSTPLIEDEFKIDYSLKEDKIELNGYLNLLSKKAPNDLIKENISVEGEFNCVLPNQ
jgi:hypothetical protein